MGYLDFLGEDFELHCSVLVVDGWSILWKLVDESLEAMILNLVNLFPFHRSPREFALVARSPS